ncbi:TPA: hypothetical protein ACLBGZ_001801 [Neisseria meningitidis]
MIVIIFINRIINQIFMDDCTGLYVPFTTIFANKRKRRIFRRHKTAASVLSPVLPPVGIIRIVQKMPYNRRTSCPADASVPSGKQNTCLKRCFF